MLHHSIFKEVVLQQYPVGATAPTGPSDGDLWYNSNYGRLFVYYKDGSSDQWVDAAPFNYSGITTSTYTENSFVATAGQTTFSVTYDVGYVDVFLNGIRLSSSEYTAANGTSVVLNEAAALGDVVDIIEVATNRGPTGPQGATGSLLKMFTHIQQLHHKHHLVQLIVLVMLMCI
jgi:hypothetical protein